MMFMSFVIIFSFHDDSQLFICYLMHVLEINFKEGRLLYRSSDPEAVFQSIPDEISLKLPQLTPTAICDMY